MFHYEVYYGRFNNIGMIDSVVSILKLADDGFHKLGEGHGIYVVLQCLM